MEPILRKNLTPAQVNTLLQTLENPISESIDENYRNLAIAFKGHREEITYTALLKWILINFIDNYKELTHTEVKNLIIAFGEKPYRNEHKLNEELLDQLLNQYHYDSTWNFEEIENWIYSQSKKLQKEHIKLTTQYDKTINEEASKFIEKHGYKRIIDESETTLPCILLIHDPVIFEDPKFKEVINKNVGYSKKKGNNIENIVSKDGVYIEYYINRLTKIEKIYEQLDRIYEKTKQVFKIIVDFGFIVQKKETIKDIIVNKYSVSPPDSTLQKSIPHTITNKTDLESYKHYIASNISEKMELHHLDSITRYVAIVTSLFKVIPLGKTGAKMYIKGYGFLLKNNFVSYDEDENICMFYALAKAKNPSLKLNPVISIAKKLFATFYNLSTVKALKNKLANYQGMLPIEEQKFCDTFNVNIRYYFTEPDEQRYDVIGRIDTQNPDENTFLLNLLRIPLSKNKFHVVLIKDVERLTNLYICPHCNEYVHDKIKDRKNIGRFEKHKEVCEKHGGKMFKEVSLKNLQFPYAPHIQKQLIFEFLLANNLQEYFQPTQYYITYDFESLEDPIEEEKVSSKTEIKAHHLPFMVSSVVKLPNQYITKNFSHDSDKEFILSWINFLFEYSHIVCQANIDLYKNVLPKLSEDKLERFNQILNREFDQCSVIGFNSGKFGIDLILNHLAKY